MSENRVFYKVTPGSDTESKISKFNDMYDSVRADWFAFAKKYGAKEIFCKNRIMAIKIESEDIPKGWNSPKSIPKGFYKPQKRKCCMEAYNEFKDLKPDPDGWDLLEILGISIIHDDRAFHFPSFEIIGETLLLSAHKDSKNIPADVEPLKMSEYWSMKESQEQ